MTKQYVHRVTAWWTSGRGGIATSESSSNAIHFTAPPEFKGLEGMWTPEDLMLSAIASCFVTTFHCIAEYASFEYQDLQVEAEGNFGKADSGYKFKQVLLRPTLRVPSPEQEKSALKLLENTKMLCLISRAISTPLIFEPRVDVESPCECVGVAKNGSVKKAAQGSEA